MSRVSARNTLTQTTAAAAGTDRRDRQADRNAGFRDAGPAGQRAGVLRGADLCSNQRLLARLAHGHRHAGQEGSAARRDRDAGGGSAAAARRRRTSRPPRQTISWPRPPTSAGKDCSRPNRCRSRTPTSARATRRRRKPPSSRRPPTSRACARWSPSSGCSRRSMGWSPSATRTSVHSSTPGRAPERRCSESPTPIGCESTCPSRKRTHRASAPG